MSFVGIGVYVVGIPALFGWLLWSYRARVEENRVRYWLGNLYYCYKRKFFWFEMLILVRRLLLATLISVLPADGILLPILVLTAFCVSLLVHLWLHPFTSRADNWLEAISIVTTALTFIAQYLMFIDPTDNDSFSDSWGESSSLHDGIIGAVVATNFALLLVMLGVLLWPLFKWVGRNSRLLWRLRRGRNLHSIRHRMRSMILD